MEYSTIVDGRGFGLDELDDADPFEIDRQAAHLFKHPRLGIDDIYDVWDSGPLFYPAKPPAHGLMIAEIAGRVLIVPLAPSRSGDMTRCRPVGCYEAVDTVAQQCHTAIQEAMNASKAMTADEEYEFYARGENQVPQGAPVRRRARLSEMVPVRFTPDLLGQVRTAAADDDRSVAAWVRRAVEHELRRGV